jgi:hypothetical protein
MPNFDKKYLFRMTHIENIPHILRYGITHADSAYANPSFIPIGDGSLIQTRNDFILNNGKRLGDYIPFYFGYRTPMLFVIQNGFNMVRATHASHIVYCVSSVQKMLDTGLDFVFTDGHAVDRFSAQYTIDDIENIESIIDWPAIQTKYWKDKTDLDLKRRKEAEFLVLGGIPIEAILGYIVYNNIAYGKLIEFGISQEKVIVKPDYYF